MKVEKLPSGSYRVRKQINGKRATKVFDHKPMKAEIDEAFAEFVISSKKEYNERTFKECAQKYIEAKSNVLSPSTLGEYTLKVKRLSQGFQGLVVDDITRHDIQEEINRMAEKLSPKTVADMNGFIQAVLGLFQTNFHRYPITLPQRKKEAIYIPTDADIKAMITAAEGTPFDLAVKLGCWGLRRSEICCITASDVEKIPGEQGCAYLLHINKAIVQNKASKEWVIKSTKTTESERDIIIPEDIAEEIIKRGRAYEGYPGSISNWLRRTQNKMGIKNFSLHKERHFFATQLMEFGCSQKDVQKMGGWATDKVLSTIYQHSRISSDQARQQAISAALLSKLS